MKRYLYSVFFIMALLVSCNKAETEELFSDSPSQRLEKQALELKDELVTPSYGWKLVYQTNENKFGAFTVLMKFDEEGTVTMTSDIDEDTAQSSSVYQIKELQGVSLSFVTKNHIHKLADSYTPGLRGKGYEGEFEFIYIGKEDDKLKFRTQKTDKVVYLEKATPADWTIVATPNTSSLLYNGYLYFAKVTSAKDGVQNFKVDASPTRRKITLFLDDEQYDLLLTPSGDDYIVNPAVEIKGKKITKLTYNATENKYVASVDDVSIEITYRGYEPWLYGNGDSDNLLNDGFDLFFTYYLGNSSLKSESFSTLLNAVPNYSSNLQRINMVTDDDGETFSIEIRYNFNGTWSYLYLVCKYELRDNKLFLKDDQGLGISPSSARSLWIGNPAVLRSSIALLSKIFEAGSQGYYIEKRSENFEGYGVYVYHSVADDHFYFPTLSLR